jgi:hypothetical protein
MVSLPANPCIRKPVTAAANCILCIASWLFSFSLASLELLSFLPQHSQGRNLSPLAHENEMVSATTKNATDYTDFHRIFILKSVFNL